MLAVLILTLLAELFIFNFTSFKLNGDYEKTTLSLENATLSGFEYKDGKLYGEEVIEVDDEITTVITYVFERKYGRQQKRLPRGILLV